MLWASCFFPGGMSKESAMLVLLPDRDRAGRNDYRGAFRPEADRLRVLFQLAESQVLERACS